jgi:hypothetical protein
MEVININSFLEIKKQQYKETCEMFGESFNLDKFEIYKKNVIIKFNDKLKPLLDKKFKFVGSENSLFNPLRKIEMVWFQDGIFYEVFKYKRGRKSFMNKIEI